MFRPHDLAFSPLYGQQIYFRLAVITVLPTSSISLDLAPSLPSLIIRIQFWARIMTIACPENLAVRPPIPLSVSSRMRGLLKRNFGALNYNERCVISDMPTTSQEERKVEKGEKCIGKSQYHHGRDIFSHYTKYTYTKDLLYVTSVIEGEASHGKADGVMEVEWIM